ncbi:hypothetical protein evm_011904 [Chilo suppressalis]|nr:hypothetical protein evm_011904 [Chilo suppressalis]
MENIGKSGDWGDSELLEPTSDSNIAVSIMEEEGPTLTVAAIVGVTVVVLLAIAAVFLLGVLIDWRQHKTSPAPSRNAVVFSLSLGALIGLLERPRCSEE